MTTWNQEEAIDQIKHGGKFGHNRVMEKVYKHNTNNTPFLPNFDDWARMYNQWSDRMAKSLWSFGSNAECREAVYINEDGRIVVGAIPSVKNANNLYQIKNRIMNLLMASADRFEGIFDELMAA